MAMNREQKRAAQKAGQVDADGSQTTVRDRRAPAKSLKTERTKPGEFVREVRSELKKVSWPTRDQMTAFTIVTLVTSVALTGFVFALDFGLKELVFLAIGGGNG